MSNSFDDDKAFYVRSVANKVNATIARDQGFQRRFGETPLRRTKRRGLLRNVCVALGNAGAAEDLPALERAAEDSEPLISEHARWAIGRIRERLKIGESEPAPACIS